MYHRPQPPTSGGSCLGNFYRYPPGRSLPPHRRIGHRSRIYTHCQIQDLLSSGTHIIGTFAGCPKCYKAYLFPLSLHRPSWTPPAIQSFITLEMLIKYSIFAAAMLPSLAHTPRLEARTPDPICVQISSAISSSSDVYYAGSVLYDKDISHWAVSSTQLPKCTVEPGNAADVGIILRILGSTRTPFAVKGGGHATNPGFSSSTGVLIAMFRFSEVTYDPVAQTAVIGAGLIWDDVYASLEPHGVNVVGGRVTGVGVAGFTLGGGYSWKTNQYGLTVDTVTAFELVKPSGVVATITESSHPNLFFALKGGFNNYGIVTRFTLKTFPQTQVWGGLIMIDAPYTDNVSAAVAEFLTTNTDPKASIITGYNFVLGSPGVSQLLFYDGPTPPTGIFDAFLDIPYLTKDVSTRSFLSLVLSSPINGTFGTRGTFNTASLLGYSPALLNAIVNETAFWGTNLSLKSAALISYDVEAFLPTLFSHSSSASAYPPTRSLGLLPLNLYFAWTSSLFDSDFHDAVTQSVQYIRDLAIAEGQTNIVGAPLYPNYAISGTPLSDMYGSNVATLQALKSTIDPTNIMGLAGGWKF